MDYNAVSTLIQDLEEAQNEKEQLVVDLEEKADKAVTAKDELEDSFAEVEEALEILRNMDLSRLENALSEAQEIID